MRAKLRGLLAARKLTVLHCTHGAALAGSAAAIAWTAPPQGEFTTAVFSLGWGLGLTAVVSAISAARQRRRVKRELLQEADALIHAATTLRQRDGY